MDVFTGVPLAKARAVAGLFGSAAALPWGSAQQKNFLLRSSAAMLCAKAVVAMAVRDGRPETLKVDVLAAEGWISESERAIFELDVQTGAYRGNPFLLAFAGAPQASACTRKELVSNEQWYLSEYVQSTFRPLDVDELLLARTVVHGEVQMWTAFLRSWRDRYRFHSRDAALALTLAEGFGPVMCVRAPETIPPKELPRRMREVYGMLVHGMSEAAIAAQLGISGRTAHHHVTRLYRALGVHSRAELLAIHAKWTLPGEARDA